MDNADRESLEWVYEQWPTEKLIRALTVDADQYGAEALPVISRILDARGLSEPEIEAIRSRIRSEHEAATQQLSRIRGVLLVFILLVIGNSLLFLGNSMTFATTAPSPPFRLLAVPFAMLGVYGLYCSGLLFRKRTEAPKHAQRWIILSFIVAVGLAVLGYLATGRVSVGSAGSATFALVWLSYLSQSRRVALVYGHYEPPPNGRAAR